MIRTASTAWAAKTEEDRLAQKALSKTVACGFAVRARHYFPPGDRTPEEAGKITINANWADCWPKVVLTPDGTEVGELNLGGDTVETL